MSWFLRVASLLRSSEGAKATLQTALTAFKNVKATMASMETAAMQELMSKAEQGDPRARYDFGERYYFGNSVPQDYAEAARWFLRAAEQGHAQAQANLGMMLALGRGVDRDYVEALKWLNLAAARGNQSALKTRNTLLKRLSPEDIAEGQHRASVFVAAPAKSPSEGSPT